jgi:hypothetical protein
LYHHHAHEWQHYQPFTPQSTHSYQLIGMVEDLDILELQLALVHWSNGTLQVDGAAPSVIITPLAPGTIQEFLLGWPGGWILEDSYFPMDPIHIREALLANLGVLITNGSYKPMVSHSLGVAAWHFECGISGTICRGECQTSGQMHEVNPYQSELQGLHAGLCGMLAFCTFHGISTGSFSVGCDCESGFKCVDKWSLNVSPVIKHSDLIHAI